MIHGLLMQEILHRHTVKNLLNNDFLIEPGGTESDQVSGLTVQGVLLIAHLHHRRFELNVRLIDHITGAYHLVDVYWIGFQILK